MTLIFLKKIIITYFINHSIFKVYYFTIKFMPFSNNLYDYIFLPFHFLIKFAISNLFGKINVFLH